ncbi:DNA topoisomerase 1 [Tetrabaena socialis]|uniref:DNA topoisomerase 1 n=1 Tax=Tetrabaena socialis TaxID=47790 RepID=A0A2J8A648_9CHLO|nr:DNA topoisomerase 1 [Tetrabaena socialis]|eukprot:PNH07973.1 DNA topoisomerase 1 [Tetrabaena socialis]
MTMPTRAGSHRAKAGAAPAPKAEAAPGQLAGADGGAGAGGGAQAAGPPLQGTVVMVVESPTKAKKIQAFLGPQYKHVLSAFWGPFHSTVTGMEAIRTTVVYDALDADLESYFFPGAHALVLPPPPGAAEAGGGGGGGEHATIDVTATVVPGTASSEAGTSGPGAEAAVVAAVAAAGASGDPRACPKCGVGRLVLKPSRFGGFIGCSMFADEGVACGFAHPLVPVAAGSSDGGPGNATELLLGQHPDTGEPVFVRLGPYGLYVQQGEVLEEAPKPKKKRGRAKKGDAAEGVEAVGAAPPAAKPRRAAIPKAKGLTLSSVSLEEALALLALPRTLGAHPEDGEPVVANTGRFGPYVAHAGTSASLGRRATPQEVDLELALQLLAAKRAREADRIARGLPPRGRRGRAAKVVAAKKARAPAGRKEGSLLSASSLSPLPHSTRPPGRFTEASLVRGLEEHGIGRPSTYAPIMSLLQVHVPHSSPYIRAAAAPGTPGTSGARPSPALTATALVEAAAKPAPGPSAPDTLKPAKSGYTLFLQQRWAAAKAADPEAAYREAVSQIAAEWRTLGDEGRGRYSEEAAAAAAPAEEGASKTPANKRAAVSRTAKGAGGKRATAKGAARTRKRVVAAATAAAKPAPAPSAQANPKPAKSGYTLFLQQRWAAAKAADPEAAYQGAVSQIAAEWRALGDEGRGRYSEEAAAAAGPPEEEAFKAPASKRAAITRTAKGAARKRAATAAAKMSAAGRRMRVAAAATVGSSAASSAVATAAPARPNPYTAFCQEQRPRVRAAHPDAPLGQVGKLLGEAWRALSDGQKAAYRQ